MTRPRLLSLLSCLAVSLSIRALMVPAGAQTPLDFSKVVIFATNSAKIGPYTDVLFGDIVVNEARTGPTLEPGLELSIERAAIMPDISAVVAADRLGIKQDAVVGGSVLYTRAYSQ